MRDEWNAADAPSSPPYKQRKSHGMSRTAVAVGVSIVIIAFVYWIPEQMARNDATAVCQAIEPGAKFPIDMDSLNAYRKDKKSTYGTLFAASYFPKSNETLDGNGAVILVFPGGFPFSRAYCVVNLNEGIVESTKLMFNAEDYTYCDAGMRRLWECSEDS